MITKENKNKVIKTKLTHFIYWIACTIILLLFFLIYNLEIGKSKSYAETSNPMETVKISQADRMDLDDFIQANSEEKEVEEYHQEEQVLEYLTEYKTNSEIPKGISYVVQEGREGKQMINKKRICQKDELKKEEIMKTTIIKAPFNKIVEIGGGKTTAQHQVKKGEELLVTSDHLAVRTQPDETSQKVATLAQNDRIQVIEITQNWYKISCKSTIGWVKQECTTYYTKEVEKELENVTEMSKQQLIGKLNFQMALNKPSGLSLAQFKKVLTDPKDKNKVFEKQAEYFYYIEKQYQINGIFVASVAVHESAWGTSKIALAKNNLFGYGAYDKSPYQSAYEFTNYAQSIDLLARVFMKYYLNPKGTQIYGGETAVGSYYYGPTLKGVNTKYASDLNWANAVYAYMQYFYNKL